ncbi:MAG: hypothetical protein AAF353_04065 [Pseudomonadota bacterium]
MPGENIDFQFERKTAKVCTLSTNIPERTESLVGKYRDSMNQCYVVETNEFITAGDPELRYEKTVLPKGRSAAFVPSGWTEKHSFIQVAVDANKQLLNSVAASESSDIVLAFVRLNLKKLPAADTDIELKFRRRFAGAFFQTEVIFESNSQGSIFFGEWT